MFGNQSRIKRMWLIFGACLIVFISAFLWWQSREKGPEKTVKKYLEALHSKKVSEAYAFTAHDFQTAVPLSDFREFLKAYGLITSYVDMQISPVEFKEDGVFVTTILTGSDKELITLKFTLVNEGDTWKILKVWGDNKTSPVSSSDLVKWLIPIDKMLRALRPKDFENAYKEHSLKVLKTSSLEAFKQFVNSNPILLSHNNYVVQQQSRNGDETIIEIVFDPDKGKKNATPFMFTLEKEDGQWKILNMGPIAGFEIVSAMREPIEKQLAALKDHNILQAYQDYTSKEFRSDVSLEVFKNFLSQYPIFIKFQRAEIKEHRLENGTWLMIAELDDSDGKTYTAEYSLGMEGDQWKIWRIRLPRRML